MTALELIEKIDSIVDGDLKQEVFINDAFADSEQLKIGWILTDENKLLIGTERPKKTIDNIDELIAQSRKKTLYLLEERHEMQISIRKNIVVEEMKKAKGDRLEELKREYIELANQSRKPSLFKTIK